MWIAKVLQTRASVRKKNLPVQIDSTTKEHHPFAMLQIQASKVLVRREWSTARVAALHFHREACSRG